MMWNQVQTFLKDESGSAAGVEWALAASMLVLGSVVALVAIRLMLAHAI